MEEILIKYEIPELQRSLFDYFIDTELINLNWVREHGYGKDVQLFCANLDYVEENYRHYLVGINKNLKRVNDGLRKLIDRSYYEPGFIKLILLKIEKEILQLELYELMPRHLNAKPKVLRFIKDVPSGNDTLMWEINESPPWIP